MKRLFQYALVILLCTGSLPAQSRRISMGDNPFLFQGNQILRRYKPEIENWDSYERIYGNEGFSRIYFDKGLPVSTIRAFAKLIAERYKDLHSMNSMTLSISKMPLANDVYLLSLYPINENRDAWLYLVIKKQGENFVELSRISNRVGCEVAGTIFFIGKDRVLIVFDIHAGDSGFCGNYAFEYKDESLKSLGEIGVFYVTPKDEQESGTAFGQSPISRATAEFRDNTYYIIMRGEGNLYAGSYDNRNPRRIAPRGVPVTYFFDRTIWRPVRSSQTRRR